MAEDTTKLILVLEAQSKKAQNELVRMNQVIDKFAAATERRFDQMQKKSDASFAKLGANLKSSVGGLQNLLAPIAGALGVQEIIRYADTWTAAGNKIAAAASVAGLQARSLDELNASANGARTSLEEYVDLYSRLLRASTTVQASETEVAQVTDIVAKSLKAGGASAQEQTASLIQLGQALSSGFLQGDELRSLRENAPLLARAIAKEFGVTIGQLKQLGADGKLTSERVFKAILNGGQEIETAFSKTRSTIGDAFTRIENSFTAYIGTAGQANGATQALIDSLNYLADNFKGVADAATVFAAILAGALAGKAVLGVVVGLGEAIAALATFLTALQAGTLTVAVFSAALGPIALIASAAAVGIGLLVYEQGAAARAAEVHNQALAGNSQALDTAIDGSQRFRDSLKRNIEVQLIAAQAALEEAKAQEAAARARLQQQANAAYALHGKTAPADLEKDAPIFGLSDTVTENQKYIDKLQAQLDAINKIMSTPPGSDGGGGGGGGGSKPTKDDPYQKRVKSIIDSTEALIAQTDAQSKLNPLVNDYGRAVDVAKTKQELLVAAHEAGLKITPELRQQIEFLANGYGDASVAAQKLTEAQDEARQKMEDYFSSAKDATRGFIDDLIQGKSAAEALGNVFNKLGSKLIDLGLDTIFGTGKGSSPYGLIGNLFGFAKGGLAANGRPVPLKTFAKGGVSDTAAIFGEGPQVEAAVPLPDGRRIPVDLRMPKMAANNNGPNVTYAPVIDARGADQAAVVRLERALAKHSSEFEVRVVGTLKGVKAGRYKV